MINHFALAWLGGDGALKYANSRRLYGASWDIGVEVALGYWMLRQQLEACRTQHDVVRVFRGRWFWKPDDVFQLFDTVRPPDHLLANGGDDCDGWAMAHTQAINYALGRYGWKAWCISYLAEPRWLSHHYCLARDPAGQFWVIQPQPTEADWKNYGERNQTVFGPFRTAEETPHAVASWYRAGIVWWDKRDGFYRPAT